MRTIIKKKKMGILMIAVLLSQMQVQAGWFSGFGDRLINGVVNTVQTNISRKANTAVDNALDGKLGNKPNNKKTNSKNQETSITPTQDSKVSDKSSEQVVESKVTSTNKKGNAISYTGKYDKINFGKFSFIGEEIYNKQLLVGQTNVVIRELLDPGYYVIHAQGTSYEVGIIFAGIREDEGIPLGYGVNIKKTIVKDAGLYLTGNKDGVIHVVEVAKGTQGLLEVALVNHESLKGSGNLSIYKIPGPNLEMIK